MNSNLIAINSIRFIVLILAQVAIFNKINFLGYINPFPYILFILLYPVNGNKTGLVLLSFLLGIILDMFSNSGGVHAAACITLAYLRPMFFKFSFGVSYEYQTVKIVGKLTSERFSFLLISVISHHLILFILEFFKLRFFFHILSRTLLSACFTLLICILIIYLFKPIKR